jgi:hypothetical protein
MKALRKRIATTVMALGLMLTSASAATYNVVGSFGGGQLGTVSFDLTIDGDFTSFIGTTANGLTINSLSSSTAGTPFSLTGGLGYAFFPDFDILVLGGLQDDLGGLSADSTDFYIRIIGFTSANPTFMFDLFDSLATTPALGFPRGIGVSVTEVSVVPLPAGGVLLLTGFAGLAGLRWRMKRLDAA